MSDLDLSVAVEAAARAMLAMDQVGYVQPLTWEDLAPISRHSMAEAVLPLVAAVVPAIEAAVRAQVAAEIRAGIGAEPLLMYVTDWRDGMETAEAIAGGADT